MILFRRARRRTPGIYVFRTRRHARRGTEWGYAGKSNHLALRRGCHVGTCTRHEGCKGGKPWADLIVRYWSLRLPWWLGWQWVTLSLETIVIAILRPRYNIQKNPRRSKVPASVQVLQRAARDRAAMAGHPMRLGASPIDLFIRCAAVAIMVTGAVGWLLTR